MGTVIRMPEVLAGATEAALQTWLVSAGDEITVGQPIAEVETEKAVVEYEAEQAGVLASILVETGVQVAVGTPIAVLAGPGESAEQALAATGSEIGAPTPEPASGPAGTVAAPEKDTVPAAKEPSATEAPGAARADSAPPAVDAAPEVNPSGDADSTARRFMSPLVRRLSAERGLDLSAVKGTGPGGRIVRRDLDAAPVLSERAASPVAPPAPAAGAPSAAASSGHTDVPLSGMRRAIARRLVESVTTIPHFYLVAECRVDELFALRQKVNAVATSPISVNDFVVKATAAAFVDVPEANAIWTDGAIRRFDEVSIAVAVSVDDGLVTPVLKAVNRTGISEISASIRELAERGRAGRLKQNELEGGSFSVSNLGMFGTEEFSAIINPPHSGILAVGAASKRPVVDSDGQLAVATVMTVTMSADHRVLDGALAARWLSAFKARIENPLSLLL
ncbi:dihydrolipoamide acetyltransferase family protein [Mycetocola sp. 2940]|uniref:dihydrolipoamide acetyltransferase family protein n=1 Tax=Mycetocola sp. 2940 TaxID=3156452 RepID=UPI003391DD87